MKKATEQRVEMDYIYMADGEPVFIETIQKQTREEVIAQYIKRRKELKLTQDDLAKRTGMARTNITRFEGGKYNPSLEMMVKIAAAKYPGQVEVLCGDVENTDLGRKFDRIMVYNAFPHFPDPENLIRVLSALLAPGGTLTVAHGMSRAAIDHRHEGAASKVSCGLMSEDDLAKIFSKHLTVTTKISNDHMYQVTGKLL